MPHTSSRYAQASRCGGDEDNLILWLGFEFNKCSLKHSLMTVHLEATDVLWVDVTFDGSYHQVMAFVYVS